MSGKKRKKGVSNTNPNQIKDFKKQKRKVGQKKEKKDPVAFSSKHIFIPVQQGIVEDNKNTPLTHRNLTLSQLTSQLHHYNCNVRKDGLMGIKELTEGYPSLIKESVGNIIEPVFQLISDEEKKVRRSVLSLLTALFELFDAESIGPFLPLFVAHMSSAMTHLSPLIRMDSLPILNLWFHSYPSTVARYAKEILNDYMAMLAPSSSSSSSSSSSASSSSSSSSPVANAVAVVSSKKIVSLEARMAILSSVYKFLQALQHTNSSANSTQQQLDVDADVGTAWTAPSLLLKRSCSSYTYYFSAAVYNSFTESSGHLMQQYAPHIIRLLLECWIETSPAQHTFAAATSAHSLDYMELILNLLKSIFKELEQLNDSNTNSAFMPYFKDFMKFLFVYFPISSTTADPKIIERIIAINVSICSVFSHFINEENKEEEWIDTLIEYIADVFNGKVHSTLKLKVESVQGALVSLLPVLTKLITSTALSAANCTKILQAFTTFEEQCHPLSSAKQSCVWFMSCILNSPVVLEEEILKVWIIALPKLLWQLQTHNPAMTKQALATLHSFMKSKRAAPYLQNIATAIIPFFWTTIKKRKQSAEQQVFGPFIRLPEDIQKLAIELLYYLPCIALNLQRALVAASAHMHSSVLLHLLEYLHCNRALLTASEYLSVLLNILLANAVHTLSKPPSSTAVPSERIDMLTGADVPSERIDMLTGADVPSERIDMLTGAVARGIAAMEAPPLAELEDTLTALLQQQKESDTNGIERVISGLLTAYKHYSSTTYCTAQFSSTLNELCESCKHRLAPAVATNE